MDEFPPDEESSGTRKIFSRVLVIIMFTWILGFGLVALYRSVQPQTNTETKTVVSPFKPWDGEWQGEIIVTDAAGTEVRKAVQRRTYRHVLSDKDFRQEGHFYESTANGEEELESQMNSMDFKFLVLKRKAIRNHGTQTIDYVGEHKDGKLVWSHRVPMASFVLTEWVDGNTMRIEGEETIKEAGTEKIYSVRGEFHRTDVEETKPVDAPGANADNNGAKSNDAQTTNTEVAQ